MPIDATPKGKTDRSRINPTQEHEVRYWMKRWGVSRSQPKWPYGQVGPRHQSRSPTSRQAARCSCTGSVMRSMQD